MHSQFWTVFAGVFLLSVGATQAQSAREWQLCDAEGHGTSDERIRNCTALIQSSRETPTNRAIAYYNRGNVWRADGDDDRAITDYDKAIELNPKYAHAFGNRARSWQSKGDLDRAVADFSEAVRLDPKNVKDWSGRGDAYQAKGDYDRAIADYDQVIRLDPKDASAYNNRGNGWYGNGDYDRAIADYNEAIRLDPKDASAHNNRGNALHRMGDYDRAIANYNEAIRLDPKYASAYNNRGNAWQRAGDYDRAIADHNEAIRLDPRNTGAYFSRARADLYSGALLKALVDLNLASMLSPKYAYTALWLDIVNKRSNLPSRLAEATNQIDMTKWPAPVIRLYLGQSTPEAVLAAADDPDARTKNDRVCEANFYSGEWGLQRGDKEEATRLFRQAAANCSKAFVEYEGAAAELKALGTMP
jgi:lipoprotein NlpI